MTDQELKQQFQTVEDNLNKADMINFKKTLLVKNLNDNQII